MPAGKTQVPAPFLVTLSVMSGSSYRIGVIVFAPVLLPARVSVAGAALGPEMELVLVNATVAAAALPEASIVLLALRVNSRLVLWAVAPVYCSVPPLKTRSAAFDEVPMLLAEPL